MRNADLIIVVNGEPTVVIVEREISIGTIIPDALEQTRNVGQPPENWEFRDIDGQVIDPDTRQEDYYSQHGQLVFLNLKAGIGASDEPTQDPNEKEALKWFSKFSHQPSHAQTISRLMFNTATALYRDLPDGREKTAGLRKLLEAKDCFVRAAIEAQEKQELP